MFSRRLRPIVRIKDVFTYVQVSDSSRLMKARQSHVRSFQLSGKSSRTGDSMERSIVIAECRKSR